MSEVGPPVAPPSALKTGLHLLRSGQLSEARRLFDDATSLAESVEHRIAASIGRAAVSLDDFELSRSSVEARDHAHAASLIDVGRRAAAVGLSRIARSLLHNAAVAMGDLDQPLSRAGAPSIAWTGRLRSLDDAVAWARQVDDLLLPDDGPGEVTVARGDRDIVSIVSPASRRAPVDVTWRVPGEDGGGEPERSTRRGTNIFLRDAVSGLRPLTLSVGRDVLVDLYVGPARRSDVSGPAFWPDHLLPTADLDLDVMFSSSDFSVFLDDDADAETEEGRSAVTVSLVLPMDARQQTDTASVRMRPPSDGRRSVRARIGIYFRDALVQSFLISGNLVEGSWKIEQDYALSVALGGDLENISERHRLSVLVNDNGHGAHEIVVRPPGLPDLRPSSFTVSDTSVAKIAALRRLLNDRGLTSASETKGGLVGQLRRLAPVANRAYLELGAGLMETVLALAKHPDAILSISRPADARFTVPWALLYTIHIEDEFRKRPDKIALCPLLGTEWDDTKKLVSPGTTRCPHAGVHPQKNVLCPFGFLGFRFVIESIVDRKQPVTEVKVSDSLKLLVLRTTKVKDKKALDGHVERIREITKAVPDKDVVDRDTASSALQQSLDLVYFYCHGQATDSSVHLAIGRDETISPEDFTGWVLTWIERNASEAPWRATAPLVFINACHAMAIEPETSVSYIDAFIRTAGAGGVIGPETKVEQGMARQFADDFFSMLFDPEAPGRGVGEILHALRLQMLEKGSIFGLLYTPHCFADLRVTH